MNITSLMAGGDIGPDIDLSPATAFELWLESLTEEERKEIEENGIH